MLNKHFKKKKKKLFQHVLMLLCESAEKILHMYYNHHILCVEDHLQRVLMKALWIFGSLRTGVSPPGSGSSGSGSPWRHHEVKPGAACKFNKKLLCMFLNEMSHTSQNLDFINSTLCRKGILFTNAFQCT